MIKTIVITEPRPFYSSLDEDCFFQWLQSIPNVCSVTGCDHGLEVALEEPINQESLTELLAVLSRYSVDLHPLKDLCAPTNENWFRNPMKYWYTSVFGENQS